MVITGETYILCLQIGLSDRDYEQTLKDCLEYMDKGIKTSDRVCQERLSICNQYGFLRNRARRLCGCFVAPRAAKIYSHCVDTPVK